MPISKYRAQFNKEHYHRIKDKYPIWVVKPHYYLSKLSPGVFQKLQPKIMFAAIPLEDGVHWAFENQDDLSTFERWAKNVR